MLCANHSSVNRDIEFFMVLLDSVIHDKDEYKGLVDNVLFETKELLERNKDIFSIDRSNYQIIMYLEGKVKEHIKNRSEFTKEDYKKIFKTLNDEIELAS